MSRFRSWLQDQPNLRHVELFEADSDGVVATQLKGRNKRRLLKRSQAMEAAVIELVQQGLAQDDWLGLLYVMCRPPRKVREPEGLNG